MSKKKLKTKKYLKQLKPLLIVLGYTSLFGLFFVFIGSSFWWAKKIDHLHLENITVRGNDYLNRDQIIETSIIPMYPNLLNLNINTIQESLENHPFIKSAIVSRDFPSSLNIDVVERLPLAYINNTSQMYLVDSEGIVLPVRKGQFDFDVPILSGFNSDKNLYPIGNRSLSKKVLEAVSFLTEIKNNHTDLYNDLSEVQISSDDEYILCLSKYPTKIYLGVNAISNQLSILHEFSIMLKNKRSLHDFHYVDLRYKNQVIVKERV